MADYNSDRTGSNIDLTLDKVDALDAKVQPTATGVDVTGTVTADSLTVESTGDLLFETGVQGNADANEIKFKTINSSGFDLAKIKVKTGTNFYDGNLIFQTQKAGFAGALADRLLLSNNGDVSFYEDTGTTAKMVWDASAESLGIGTSSPNQLLEVANVNGGATINISTDQSPGSASSKKYTNLDFSGYNNTVNARIQSWDESSSTGWGHLTFHTADGSILSEAMRIDKSGNVGIGTASPGQKLHVESGAGSVTRASIINTGNAAAGAGIQLITKNGSTQVSNATLRTDNAGNFSIFSGTTSDPERMRIDSSGNLMVATTNTQPAQNNVNGSVFGLYGGMFTTKSNAIVADINRKGSDGPIVNFRKDGSSVGSIGTNGGTLYISSPYGSDAGLRIGNGFVAPSDVSGVASDNTVDLGYSGNGFKNLFLSGDIKQAGINRQVTSVSAANDVEYTFDFDVVSTGNGATIKVYCAYNHYGGLSYGAWRESILSYRSNTQLYAADIIEHNTTQAGGWTFSMPDSTTLRVTKTAGTYTGIGLGQIIVESII